MIQTCYAGCDIASRWLDLCILSPDSAPVRRHANTAAGLAGIVDDLVCAGVALVVLEPSGGYERPLLEALWAAGIAVALVPAQRVRHFARAGGQLAKTDAIDARILAEYGAAMQPAATPAPEETSRHLRDLTDRRRVLIEARKAERQRAGRTARPRIAASIARITDAITAEIEALTAEIRALICANHAMRDREARLRSCPGIGPATAAVLLARMPELGQARGAGIAALAGLAPHPRDSGARRGARFISGGRKQVRDAIFMAATSAALHSRSRFADHYQNLRKRGKPHKVAIIAIARKMLTTLNAMVRENRDFQY